eukprot:359461-Chlamydomonas_euryale.AAC.5
MCRPRRPTLKISGPNRFRAKGVKRGTLPQRGTYLSLSTLGGRNPRARRAETPDSVTSLGRREDGRRRGARACVRGRRWHAASARRQHRGAQLSQHGGHQGGGRPHQGEQRSSEQHGRPRRTAAGVACGCWCSLHRLSILTPAQASKLGCVYARMAPPSAVHVFCRHSILHAACRRNLWLAVLFVKAIRHKYAVYVKENAH